jgi:aspartate-semialdehyde dehydrogenase
MVRILKERRFPVKELRILARSDREMEIDGEKYGVRATTPEAFEGVDIALFAGTEGEKGAAVTFGEEAVKRGAVVIDNGSDFRMDPRVPLVVPEVNGEDVEKHEGYIANPNCSTVGPDGPCLEAAVRPLAHQAHRGQHLPVRVRCGRAGDQGVGGAGQGSGGR